LEGVHELLLSYSVPTDRTYVRDYSGSGFEFYLSGDHRSDLTESDFNFIGNIKYGTSENDVFGAERDDIIIANDGDDTISAGSYRTHAFNRWDIGYGIGGAKVYGGYGSDIFNFACGTTLQTSRFLTAPRELGFETVKIADYDFSEGDKIRIEHVSIWDSYNHLFTGDKPINFDLTNLPENYYGDISTPLSFADIQAALQDHNGSAYIAISGGILLEGITTAQVTAEMFEFV
jgi:Ca2+-binding RTX toxin-like protein